MNERAFKILGMLSQNEHLKLSDLSISLGLTKRQITYAIDQINESLVAYNYSPISIKMNGQFQVPDDLLKIIATFKNEEDHHLMMDSDIRRVLIAVYIYISDFEVTLLHLVDLLDVSKNTVVNDIKLLNKKIQKEFSVKIEYSRKYGYELIGEEIDTTRLILSILARSSSLMNQVLHQKIAIPDNQAVKIVEEIERKLKVKYSDHSFTQITQMLSCFIRHIQKGESRNGIQTIKGITELPEYKVIDDIIIERYQLSEGDKEFIVLLFLSANVLSNEGINIGTKVPNINLEELIERILYEFQSKTLITIQGKHVFKRELLNHLRPACYRLIYGLDSYGNRLDNSLVDLTPFQSLIKSLLQPLEDEIGENFPDAEVVLISYYFESLLVNDRDSGVINAVVVCDNGLVTAKILKSNLEKYIPEINIIQSISKREFGRYEHLVNCVFTTIPLETNILQYSVSPMMNKEEFDRLKQLLINEGVILKRELRYQELYQLIIKYAYIHDEDGLIQALETYIEEINSPKYVGVTRHLNDYLKKEYIQINTARNMKWTNAVRLAANPLKEQGVIDDNFVDTIIRQTNDKDDYCFMTENFSIPHTENRGQKEGIALLILPNGVYHPNGNLIRFIAPIAVRNGDQHYVAIQELSELSNDQSLCDQLQELRDIDEVYKEIFK